MTTRTPKYASRSHISITQHIQKGRGNVFAVAKNESFSGSGGLGGEGGEDETNSFGPADDDGRG
ncbi:hypothetical protein AKJ09_01868 [Labilithrix luteola]|uniref:Uncharacterized protein n=1 Tax=Labilithrix luteola TaxID=1391654 RepID=A0A0K1PQ30_9BACT|nr:hypothetical protein AKJ09_01868 [Labilithrix luteola]